jgi:DNA polymerase III delta prime subunit
MICHNDNVLSKLNHFFETKKIPNIIFHGSSGSGKRTIVNNFLSRIYDNDILKQKNHVMTVNCSHGKGIKFIRDELKFFAKTNIQVNDVMFKSIVLLNADSLTIDAQSALRRCIELFSNNTRFFIIVENKCKLLNPILSRFCEIYVPGYDYDTKEIMNLHSYNLREKIPMISEQQLQYKMEIFEKLLKFELTNIIDLSTDLYENGFHTKQLIDYFDSSGKNTEEKKALLNLYYYKLKKDFRCEKMLLFYILKIVYFNHTTSSNDIIKNMLII